ncbi:hypothetical protein [Mycolicibacterium mageritense]|uniref:Uncharacterized protein n=1 Tax=Mycolicibacterium mageritense TaxID=53462 RepID=A0AAI8XQU8_MYCME|nr:hypothetical protein [Mycolicibacterium mageritense]BDY31390.1 hypothetical protein hbim_05342 [Mycolicibacterium mageritense]
MIDENPPLHPVQAERIPHDSWVPASIELLPADWVNVRIFSYDPILGRDLYVTDTCPGILHFESAVTEKVIQYADGDGNLFDPEFGEAYDSRPVVVGVEVADPPHRWHHHVDPSWLPAYAGGGYLGSCPQDQVRKLLTEHGFADAIAKPEGWVHPDDDE